MEIRTILVAVSGGGASEGAVETACRLARRFNSHLEGMHVAVEVHVPHWPIAGSSTRALKDAVSREGKDAAAAARRIFDAAVSRHGLPLLGRASGDGRSSAGCGASARWREDSGLDTGAIGRRARLFDLIVLGRSSRAVRQLSSATIERALLEGGRPVLVAESRALDRLGETIALAWNDSPQAARALSAALPFMKSASRTHILCFGDASMEELIEQLRWYGIQASGHRFPPLAQQRAETGELLLGATRDCQADLLAMGAYGHAPWWEALFGGATHEVLRKDTFSILLAH